MVENTDAQTQLHSELVGADAQAIIGCAREHGALGWKVNGAGGDGGSLTLLTGSLSLRFLSVTTITRFVPSFFMS